MNKELRNKITELSNRGFQPHEIAKMLGITEYQVISVLRPGE